MELGGRVIKKFADGEVYVQIQESIRGCDVFLVQPTCPPNVNDNLMELLIMIDACRRASCRSITCVIPYYGYARADRRTSGRESIAAKLAANLLTEAGATRVVMLDIHSLQTIGYFDIPVDHIYGETVILGAFYLTLVPIRPRWRGERRSLRTSSPGGRFSPPRVPRFQSRHTSVPFNST